MGLRRAIPMKAHKVAAVTALLASAAMAEETTPDRTKVERCEGLPSSASISVLSKAETLTICREVLRGGLENVTVGDLQYFEKVAYVFSRSGYEEGNYAKITAQLVDIIRRRGLYNQPPRWA
jgi:hypothetical protein